MYCAVKKCVALQNKIVKSIYSQLKRQLNSLNNKYNSYTGLPTKNKPLRDDCKEFIKSIIPSIQGSLSVCFVFAKTINYRLQHQKNL